MEIQSLNFDASSNSEIALAGIDFITNGNQYLSFCLGDEHYSVDILSVTEIRGWEKPTLIPNSPDDVLGVINLRGVIVPIVDLRIRFGVGSTSYTPMTVVIVLAVKNAAGINRTMGFVVDAVSDVLNVEDDEIKKTPNFGGSIDQGNIVGLVNVGNNVVTILDVAQLMALDHVESEE